MFFMDKISTAALAAGAGLQLGLGVSFADLYERAGLVRLDEAFPGWLEQADSELHARLLAARAEPASLVPKAESALLLAVAPHLEDFIGRLFGIEKDLRTLAARHHELAPLYSVKRLFVQRRAMHRYKADEAAAI